MTTDLLTMMWKERKGLLSVRGSRNRALLSILVPALMIAIVLPLQLADEWVTGAWPLVTAVLIPLIMVGVTVSESFAGERERHTLETLLASRLPDRVILFGKWGFSVAYGWLMTLVSLVVALVVVNAVRWTGHVAAYTGARSVVFAGVGLLMSGLMASLGVLVSLRAETAQGASQTLMMFVMVPLLVVQLGPMLLLTVVPNGQATLKRMLSVDLTWIAVAMCVLLLAIDIVLLVAAMRRFRRDKLI